MMNHRLTVKWEEKFRRPFIRYEYTELTDISKHKMLNETRIQYIDEVCREKEGMVQECKMGAFIDQNGPLFTFDANVFYHDKETRQKHIAPHPICQIYNNNISEEIKVFCETELKHRRSLINDIDTTLMRAMNMIDDPKGSTYGFVGWINYNRILELIQKYPNDPNTVGQLKKILQISKCDSSNDLS